MVKVRCLVVKQLAFLTGTLNLFAPSILFTHFTHFNHATLLTLMFFSGPEGSEVPNRMSLEPSGRCVNSDLCALASASAASLCARLKFEPYLMSRSPSGRTMCLLIDLDGVSDSPKLDMEEPNRRSDLPSRLKWALGLGASRLDSLFEFVDAPLDDAGSTWREGWWWEWG